MQKLLRPKAAISAVMVIAATLRILYAIDIPLTGDEVGVGVLQASGQAVTYTNRLPKENVPTEQIEQFVTYSKDFSIKDVLRSLRHAGMHPPLYYLMLHYILKYIGNDAFTLRLISIIISLFSIVVIYRLGKTVYNENVGVCSALFLALSAYGVMYGSMVRPYSLIMLLSLLSTLYACELNRLDYVSFNNKKLLLYTLTVLIGLYTIYHFVFVFVSQIAFLVLNNLRNKKSLLIISVMIGIIFILCLPWLPSLLDQLRDATNAHHYFHGKLNVYLLAKFPIYLNFTEHLLIGYNIPRTILVGTIIYPIILIGLYSLTKCKRSRSFAVALVVYFLCHYAGDMILNMRTLNVPKLLFFVIPILLILLAVGMSRLPTCYHLRTVSILLCCVLLLCNSIALCYYKPGFDGPPNVPIYRDKISTSLKQNQKGLVISNTNTRRYVLSFAHGLKAPIDMKIMSPDNVESKMLNISNLRDYDFIFITNYYVRYDKESFFPFQDIKLISRHLSKHDFSLIEPSELMHEPNKSSLMIFKKKPRR